MLIIITWATCHKFQWTKIFQEHGDVRNYSFNQKFHQLITAALMISAWSGHCKLKYHIVMKMRLLSDIPLSLKISY